MCDIVCFLFRSRPGLITAGSRQWGKLSTSSPIKKQPSDHEGHGVSVADEETIMSHIDEFCSRIRQIIDIVNTLSQFNKWVSCQSIHLFATFGLAG